MADRLQIEISSDSNAPVESPPFVNVATVKSYRRVTDLPTRRLVGPHLHDVVDYRRLSVAGRLLPAQFGHPARRVQLGGERRGWSWLGDEISRCHDAGGVGRRPDAGVVGGRDAVLTLLALGDVAGRVGGHRDRGPVKRHPAGAVVRSLLDVVSNQLTAAVSVWNLPRQRH